MCVSEWVPSEELKRISSKVRKGLSDVSPMPNIVHGTNEVLNKYPLSK